jgi:hypothetical protein
MMRIPTAPPGSPSAQPPSPRRPQSARVRGPCATAMKWESQHRATSPRPVTPAAVISRVDTMRPQSARVRRSAQEGEEGDKGVPSTSAVQLYHPYYSNASAASKWNRATVRSPSANATKNAGLDPWSAVVGVAPAPPNSSSNVLDVPCKEQIIQQRVQEPNKVNGSHLIHDYCKDKFNRFSAAQTKVKLDGTPGSNPVAVAGLGEAASGAPPDGGSQSQSFFEKARQDIIQLEDQLRRAAGEPLLSPRSHSKCSSGPKAPPAPPMATSPSLWAVTNRPRSRASYVVVRTESIHRIIREVDGSSGLTVQGQCIGPGSERSPERAIGAGASFPSTGPSFICRVECDTSQRNSSAKAHAHQFHTQTIGADDLIGAAPSSSRSPRSQPSAGEMTDPDLQITRSSADEKHLAYVFRKVMKMRQKGRERFNLEWQQRRRRPLSAATSSPSTQQAAASTCQDISGTAASTLKQGGSEESETPGAGTIVQAPPKEPQARTMVLDSSKWVFPIRTKRSFDPNSHQAAANLRVPAAIFSLLSPRP